MATVSTTTRAITPADSGRRMSLKKFESAEVQPGYNYELGRGVIVVSEVANPAHAAQVFAINRQLFAYDARNPERVAAILSGNDCKLLIWDYDSERHPDISIYKTPAPSNDRLAWRSWLPEIVIEVVSLESAVRDYVEKREEYLAIGVKEYWIVDAERAEMLVLTRSRGRWSEKVLKPGDVYTTKLLPGLKFDIAPVFEAARRSES